MAYSDLLINTCTIWRWADIGSDAYGNPSKLWAAVPPDEPCRISYPKGRQVQSNTEVVPVDAVLFMEDVDVTEADKVVVDLIEFEILFVADLQDGFGNHHKELSLKRVKP